MTKTGDVFRDISLSASSQQHRQGQSYLLLGSVSLPGEIASHPCYLSIVLSESGSSSESESGLSIDGISSRAIDMLWRRLQS